MAYERWRYDDPALVLERKQERTTKQSREARAREELEKLFKNFDDGERPDEQK